jgi:hypothetical protein
MSADNQKRDGQGRFKKKMFKAPDLSFPAAPKISAPSEPKKETPLSRLLKPKKQVVIPEYNPVEEALRLEAGLSKPKGVFGRKKQAEARKAAEDKFGEIDWNPNSKFEEVTPSELETSAIQSLGGPTPEKELRQHSGKSGKVFKLKGAEPEIVKVAELALLTFVEADESLSLESDNPFRNHPHVIISIDEHDVRLHLNEVIFLPKG